MQTWTPTALVLRTSTCVSTSVPANPDYVPIPVHANGVDSCVVCSSAFAPSYEGPYCSSLALPPCTYAQYTSEAYELHTRLPGVNVTPLDVEEHLAADIGCGLPGLRIPRTTPAHVAVDIAYGIFAPLVFVIFGLLIMVYIEGKEHGAIQSP